MSTVTNIILKTGLYEATISGFQKEFCTLTGGHTLAKVDHFASGSKVMELDIYMAAINGLDLDGLRRIFFRVPWENADEVQLMIQEQEEDLFKIYWIDEYPTRFVLTECKYREGEECQK